jgi:hypothetical protein
MSQNNSDKDKGNSPFPSGPSAPKPDWLKDVEGDPDESESNATSDADTEAPEGLRETQPIDSDEVGEKPAQELKTEVEDETDISDEDAEDESPSTTNEHADKKRQESASPEDTEVRDETAEDNREEKTGSEEQQDEQQASPETDEESDQQNFESQTLSKESRSRELQKKTENSKVSVSQSAGATRRPSLPTWLIQGGAVFMAGTSLLAMIGLTLNLGSFGITSTHAGIIGLIFGIIAITVERLQSNNWLADALLVGGLAITIGLMAGTIGLNAFSVGGGLLVLGIVLGILDRI